MNQPGFTQREVEILQHLQLGGSNKLIARALGISEFTVKIHIRNILRKLNASNRTQAALRVQSGQYHPTVPH